MEPLQRERGHDDRGRITQRLKLTRNAILDEYTFAASCTTKPVKVTLIGPDRIAQRFAYEDSLDIYPGGMTEFLDDVVRVQREMIAQLSRAGVGYVHIDAPGYTAYVIRRGNAVDAKAWRRPKKRKPRTVDSGR